MFSHARQRWSAKRLSWQCPKGATGCSKLDLGAVVETDLQLNNTARVALGSGGRDRLIVAVTDTNPLLYTVDRTTAKDVEAPDIADLTTFVTAFSGTLATAISQLESREVPDLDALAKAAADNVPKDKQGKALEAEAAPARIAGLLAILATVSTNVRNASVTAVDQGSAFSAFKSKADAFEKAITRINDGERALTRLVMKAEQDQELTKSDIEALDGITKEDTTKGDITEEGIRKALNDLLAARKNLDDFKGLACVNALVDVTAALSASVLATCDCQSQSDAENQQRAALDRLSITKACVDLLGGYDTDATIPRFVATLRGLKPGNQVFEDNDVRLAVQAVINSVVDYSALATARTKALEDSKKVADGQAERESRAAALRLATAEVKKLWDPTAKEEVGNQCALRRGVLIVDETDGTAQWDKLGQRGFKIAVREARAKNVQRRLAALEASYEIASRRLLHMTVGFGPIFTKLANPSWTAVQNPADEDGLVIGRADESTRAGRVAAFLTLYPDKLYKSGPQFGFDIGVATNSVETPAVFLGVSLGWRALRFGGGYTWQRVKKLASDQRELIRLPDGTFSTDATVVASKDDIRTRDGVDRAWYFTAIVNVSSLPFFK